MCACVCVCVHACVCVCVCVYKISIVIDVIYGDVRGEDVARSIERRTGTQLRPVRFPGAAKDFSPRVSFQ